MSQQQLRETEQAREQARLSAERSEKIIEAQRVMHGEVPRGPKGRPPEAVPHRKIEVKELEKAKPAGMPPSKPSGGRQARPRSARAPKPGRRGFRFRIFRQGPGFKQPTTQARLKENTPANISRAEKDGAIKRLDAQIAIWSRKYAFRVVHGGTPAQKHQAAVRLRELQAERDAIAAMKPLGLPEHIRKAEFHE